MAASSGYRWNDMKALQTRLRALYAGTDRKAARAQYALLGFDVMIVLFFVVTTFMPQYGWIVAIDVALGVLLAIELAARACIESDRVAFLLQPLTLVDIVVVASLLASALGGTFAFLRILRTLRLMRSYHILRQLRRRYRFFKVNEEVIFSALNLVVFIFVVTAAVYVLQVDVNPSITNYIDALYFTIAALTTTGFGDITLVGSTGRLLAVLIMIVGVSLFIRLVQTIFRPGKVRYSCPDCGLSRHDADAVHCKHCGHVVKIANEGE